METPKLSPELADALLNAIADCVAERIAARIGPNDAGRLATAKNTPLGKERAFLDAGRRGDFPRFKRGREVAARWSDVVAYIESRPCKPARRPHDKPAWAPARQAGRCPHDKPARRPHDKPANENTAAPCSPDAKRRAQLKAVGALPGSSHERSEVRGRRSARGG